MVVLVNGVLNWFRVALSTAGFVVAGLVLAGWPVTATASVSPPKVFALDQREDGRTEFVHIGLRGQAHRYLAEEQLPVPESASAGTWLLAGDEIWITWETGGEEKLIPLGDGIYGRKILEAEASEAATVGEGDGNDETVPLDFGQVFAVSQKFSGVWSFVSERMLLRVFPIGPADNGIGRVRSIQPASEVDGLLAEGTWAVVGDAIEITVREEGFAARVDDGMLLLEPMATDGPEREPIRGQRSEVRRWIHALSVVNDRQSAVPYAD